MLNEKRKQRNEDLKKIFEHFGAENQIEKLQEEVAEVVDAIYNKSVIDIAEEIADVEVVLEQLRKGFGISKQLVEEIKSLKIKRTLARIESGYYEKEKNANAASEKDLSAKEAIEEKQKIYNKLKRFTEEHNTGNIDWTDYSTMKYSIAYEVDEDKLYAFSTNTNSFERIYFTSREIAEQAIEEIGEEEIKKLFK